MDRVTELLIAVLPADRRPDAAASAALDAALEHQLAIARAQWPDATVALPELASLLAERIAVGSESVAIAVGGAQLADLYIACACAAGDPAALRAFEARYFGALVGAITRIGGDAATVTEVQQILREKLFVASDRTRAKILDLAGRGELGALLRLAAVRTALNLRRSTHRLDLVEQPSLVSGVVLGEDPQGGLIKDLDRQTVKAAFEDAVGALSARDRRILRMQLLHGAGIDEIARLHDVHRSTAARWLDRIRDDLRDHTRRLLGERLTLPRDDVESLVAFVQSRLEISFDRVLADRDTSTH